jgi:hypothetical protein
VRSADGTWDEDGARGADVVMTSHIGTAWTLSGPVTVP